MFDTGHQGRADLVLVVSAPCSEIFFMTSPPPSPDTHTHTHTQSYDQQYRPGVVKLCASHQSPLVYSGSLDGVVRGWDLRSGQVVREWHGHCSHILDLSLLR